MSSIFDIISLSTSAAQQENQLEACNKTSAPYGLTLTSDDVKELEVQHKELLAKHDRVEFGTPAVVQLVEGFASSPYLQQSEYAHDLADLQETFYELRSQAGVDIFDDEIVDGMRLLWDGDAAGTIELLNACTLDMVMEAYDTQTGSLAEREREILPDMTQTTEVPQFLNDVSEVNAKAIEEGLNALEEAERLPMSPWDPSEWVDDITAPGFDGERWEEDHD